MIKYTELYDTLPTSNNSRTDRPVVTKLGICTYPLNNFTPSLKILSSYLLWPLTCDLISKVMSSEICVPCRFNAWNLRTSASMLVIWTWIGVGRWHPWLTPTLWTFRGQLRSSEANNLWWRHISFFRVFVPPGVIWCADFEFGIRLPFICVEMGIIGIIKYPK